VAPAFDIVLAASGQTRHDPGRFARQRIMTWYEVPGWAFSRSRLYSRLSLAVQTVMPALMICASCACVWIGPA